AQAPGGAGGRGPRAVHAHPHPGLVPPGAAGGRLRPVPAEQRRGGRGGVAASTFCAFCAAVALTRYRFRLRTTLLVVVLIAQMVPVEALTIPLFFLMRNMGQAVPQLGLNHLGSLMLVHTAFAVPLAIWMLHGFVAAVPKELEEAAQLDGAGSLTFVTRVLFPLVAPGVVACSIFSFIMTWNDFLFAKTFIISAQENQTLPIALLSFFKPDENDWGGIMAGSVRMTKI